MLIVQLLLVVLAVAWIVKMIRSDGRGRVRLLVQTIAAIAAMVIIPLGLIVMGLIWNGNSVSMPKALASLPAYESREYWISDGFQDYTAYGKYRYAAPLTDDTLQAADFLPVDEGTVEKLNVYVEDCAGWVALYAENESQPHLVEAYDFDVQIITPGDYYHLRSDEKTFEDGRHVLYSYNLYLYDAETAIIYYLHNNI